MTCIRFQEEIQVSEQLATMELNLSFAFPSVLHPDLSHILDQNLLRIALVGTWLRGIGKINWKLLLQKKIL